MSPTMSFRRLLAPLLLVVSVSLAPTRLYAQGGPGPATAQAAAPVDLTGYWVSIVTEDWRYRMVTPAKGDYASVPLNADARKVADAWDPAKDEAAGDQCKSTGLRPLCECPDGCTSPGRTITP